MQRLRSLKEGLTLLSPGKCQQMTLSPLEQSRWLLAGQEGSRGKPGESRTSESPGTGMVGPLMTSCHFVLVAEILKIHLDYFMHLLFLERNITLLFLTWKCSNGHVQHLNIFLISRTKATSKATCVQWEASPSLLNSTGPWPALAIY